MLTQDPIVDEVINKFVSRSDEGMKRFGKSMADNNAPALDWIDEAQEEAMDLVLYLERLKKELKNGRQIRNENSPDRERRQDVLDKDRGGLADEGEGRIQLNI